MLVISTQSSNGQYSRDEIVARKTTEGQSIQEQIVIEEQLDTLRRDAEYITALSEGADVRAGVTARQGGSNSSRAVALDSMKAFGRSYNLLKTEQKKRRTALTNYNSQLAGETASQLAQIAMAMDGEVNSIKYSRASNALKLADLQQSADFSKTANLLTLADLNRQGQLAQARIQHQFVDATSIN